MILSICCQEVNDTSFVVYNNTSQQMYTQSGIDLSSVVTATLYFSRVNNQGDEVSVDIGDTFSFLFTSGGLTINFEDFGEDLINGYDFFPDGLYTITIKYIYDGNLYEAATTVGFKKTISNIVYQQLQQSNWKKEIGCSCNCDAYNTTLRKWEFLYNLDIAAELCLLAQFDTTLKALYKLTGVEYEFI
jgi:hypothetical protein